MCSIPGVGIWPFAFFLNGVVGECLAAGVLAIPDRCGGAVGKANHVVFPVVSQLQNLQVKLSLLWEPLPVSNMIPKLHAEYFITFVIPNQISKNQ